MLVGWTWAGLNGCLGSWDCELPQVDEGDSGASGVSGVRRDEATVAAIECGLNWHVGPTTGRYLRGTSTTACPRRLEPFSDVCQFLWLQTSPIQKFDAKEN